MILRIVYFFLLLSGCNIMAYAKDKPVIVDRSVLKSGDENRDSEVLLSIPQKKKVIVEEFDFKDAPSNMKVVSMEEK